ncbi:hypothetical protein CN958_04740 [Bacillus cereus]|uniref:Uncharacterized protein n=1 Tax=Bacillus cereus TaxID=1396 RepID=A0A2B9E997_BACCE|nr:hypothetical protein CN958_04740 [Bacillus cereus]
MSRFHFLLNLASAARMIGGFTSSYEAKSASTSEAPSPSHSERAAYAFYLITKFGFLFKL